MVEFVLLFALGFLTALLAGLMLAPAIHGRIVKFTEKRMRATVPMSAAELRAGRDMERARFAATNHKLNADLRQERDRRVDSTLRADRLQETAARLRTDVTALERQVETMAAEAGDLRSALRSGDRQAAALKLALGEAERSIGEHERRVGELEATIDTLTQDGVDYRIDLAAVSTEAESLKASLSASKDEKRRISARLAEMEATLKDRDYRLERETERNQDLERRLDESVARISDQENMLERRDGEIARLRERLSAATGMDTQPSVDAAETDKERISMEGTPTEPADDQNAAGRAAIARRIDKLRARHGVLVEKLTGEDEGDDAALREEIREIAANMVSLTARREGSNSPIRRILAEAGEESSGQISLAARASAILAEK